jgi:thiamine pyrophosphokinase
MRSIIIANGNLDQYPEFNGDDLIIAADGGGRHCLHWGIVPHYVIGDMDSLSQGEIRELEQSGAVLVTYPKAKDYTDLELSISTAIQKGCEEIVIYGALGERWDQTFANLLLPIHDEFHAANIRLIDGQQEVHYIRSGETLSVSGQPGDTLSLIPLVGDAAGITTRGLEYPLDDDCLPVGSTRGVSNVFKERGADVYLANGVLACVVIHNLPTSTPKGSE